MRMIDVSCTVCKRTIGTLALIDGVSMAIKCKCGSVLAVTDGTATESATESAQRDSATNNVALLSSVGQSAVDAIISDAGSKKINAATAAHRLRALATRWTDVAERTNAYMGTMAKRAIDASLPFEAQAERDAAHQAEVKKRASCPATQDKEVQFQQLCVAMSYIHPGMFDNMLGVEKFDPKRLVGSGSVTSIPTNAKYRDEARRRVDAKR